MSMLVDELRNLHGQVGYEPQLSSRATRLDSLTVLGGSMEQFLLNW